MGTNSRCWFISGLVFATVGCASTTAPPSNIPSGYLGKPYSDAVYKGGPQAISARIMFAYYDFGGEGVAYHDTTPTNLGSGTLNPADEMC
jgi:hypothetical protein